MKANAPERIWIDLASDLPKLSGYVDKDSVEYIRADVFIKKAVEGRVIDDGGEIHLIVPELPIITRNMDDGEKVKVLIFK